MGYSPEQIWLTFSAAPDKGAVIYKCEDFDPNYKTGSGRFKGELYKNWPPVPFILKPKVKLF